MVISATALLLSGLIVACTAVPATHGGFDESTIRKVEANMLEIAVHRYVLDPIAVPMLTFLSVKLGVGHSLRGLN